MAESTMHVTTENPNDNSGGGGCVCSPDKVTDCKGPFVVIPGNDMDNPYSPHVVIGSRCVDRAAAALAVHAIEGTQVVESEAVEEDPVDDVDEVPEV